MSFETSSGKDDPVLRIDDDNENLCDGRANTPAIAQTAKGAVYRSLQHLALIFIVSAGAAVPTTAWAGADEPSVRLDRELVIDDTPSPPKRHPGSESDCCRPPPRIDHVLSGELATDYEVGDEKLAMTARAIYTYKPWNQLRLSAAATQSGFGDDGLTEAVFSAGVGFKYGPRFSWRITGLLKEAERMDAATMATSTKTIPGIDGLGRIPLGDGKLITSGRIGVRFSDSTTVIGVLSEVVQINDRVSFGAQGMATMNRSGTVFVAEADAAMTLGKFELGITASTPVDNLAMTIGAYLSYTYER